MFYDLQFCLVLILSFNFILFEHMNFLLLLHTAYFVGLEQKSIIILPAKQSTIYCRLILPFVFPSSLALPPIGFNSLFEP